VRRAFAFVALSAATAAFAVDDPNAPLANTKQQLQSLKKDEAAQKAGTDRGVKLDLPSLNAPGTNVDLPPPHRPEADVKDGKRAAHRDWLLEGVDRLDHKKSSADARRGDATESEDQPLDPTDPDYFLRVYERQRTARDAKLKLNAPDVNELRTGSADPFAPFMKEWLANSPVRDALKDAATRDARNDFAAPDPAMPRPTEMGGANNTPAVDLARGAAAPNPFVQALGLPTLEQAKPAESRGPVAESSVAPAIVPPAANTIYDLPERPKIDVKRALPPPPSEDKKYFPQLKKF
jgi:hypothetical protein